MNDENITVAEKLENLAHLLRANGHPNMAAFALAESIQDDMEWLQEEFLARNITT